MTSSVEVPARRPVPELEMLGRAAAGRLRDVAAVVRRLDGLNPGGPDADASRPTREDVREFVLRALRLAAELDNARILRAVADGNGALEALSALTGRSRLALWEAVGDLVTVGLLERDPVRDGVALTAAGRALLALVDELVAAGEQR
jgi:hypothetical protein